MAPGQEKPPSAASVRRRSARGASKQEEQGGPLDADLVAACQRGDRAAQHQLYELCHRRVYALAVRIVGLQDAADVTQQVFLQVFRTIDQFSGRSRLETWLYRLAVNQCLQHLRRGRRWQPRLLQHEPTDDGAAGHEQRTENQELVQQALARLPADLRSVIVLRELEGMAYQQMAEVLGLSEGTVASKLNRARKQLKKHLIDLGWQP